MADAYAIDAELVEPGQKVTLPRSTRARPRAGAGVVIFTRPHDGVQFTEYTTIRHVDEESDQARRNVTYLLAQAERFDTPRELTVLAGSLKKVRRFLDPRYHFRRRIVALSRADYQAIVRNEIDIGRSVFRYIFHALPLHIQSAFVRKHADLFPQQSGARWFQYDELAEAMIAFLQDNVAPPLRLLEMFHHVYPRDITDFPSMGGLWLGDGASGEREDVAFGRDVEAVLRVRSSSAVLREEQGRFAFLDECRLQLREQPSSQRRRQWNDLIF